MLTIVDVGANSGELIDYFYQNIIITNINYIAIEPNKPAFEIILNEKKSKYSGLNLEFCAIAQVSGTGRLFAPNVMNGQLASLLPLNKNGNWDNQIHTHLEDSDSDKYLIIDQISVEELISKNQIEQIDFLKIDTQGTDVLILSEFLKVIDVKVIAVEVETTSIPSESHYQNSKNSLENLIELCRLHNFQIVKIFPVNSDCSEYNVFLAKNIGDYNDLNLILKFSFMPPFERFWKVLGIGKSVDGNISNLNRLLSKKLIGAFFHPISSYKSFIIKLTS